MDKSIRDFINMDDVDQVIAAAAFLKRHGLSNKLVVTRRTVRDVLSEIILAKLIDKITNDDKQSVTHEEAMECLSDADKEIVKLLNMSLAITQISSVSLIERDNEQATGDHELNVDDEVLVALKETKGYEDIINEFRKHHNLSSSVILTRRRIRHAIVRRAVARKIATTSPFRFVVREETRFTHDQLIDKVYNNNDQFLVKALDMDLGVMLTPAPFGSGSIDVMVVDLAEKERAREKVIFPQEHQPDESIDRLINLYHQDRETLMLSRCGCQSCKHTRIVLGNRLTLIKDQIGDHIGPNGCRCPACLNFRSKDPVIMHENAAKEMTDNLLERIMSAGKS